MTSYVSLLTIDDVSACIGACKPLTQRKPMNERKPELSIARSCAVQRGSSAHSGPKGSANMPCTRTSVPPSIWPPRLDRVHTTPAMERRRSVAAGNARLAAKLAGTLRGRQDQPSFAQLSHRPGASVDLNCTAPRRAHMLTAKQSERSVDRTVRRKQARASSGVPKSAGMVLCAGCGVKSFYRADGVAMHSCSQCSKVRYQHADSKVHPAGWYQLRHACSLSHTHGASACGRSSPADRSTSYAHLAPHARVQVYYCSPLCERIDAPQHAIECKAATNLGVGLASSLRSKARHCTTAVANAAARKCLHQLRALVRTSSSASELPRSCSVASIHGL